MKTEVALIYPFAGCVKASLWRHKAAIVHRQPFHWTRSVEFALEIFEYGLEAAIIDDAMPNVALHRARNCHERVAAAPTAALSVPEARV
jgi:hypothetical protein